MHDMLQIKQRVQPHLAESCVCHHSCERRTVRNFTAGHILRDLADNLLPGMRW